MSRRLAAGITAAAAGAAALVLGLSGVFGSASAAPARTATPVHLAAFSLVSHHHGTVTLTLYPSLPWHPSAIQHLLARHGVPALITIGSYCYSHPGPPYTGLCEPTRQETALFLRASRGPGAGW